APERSEVRTAAHGLREVFGQRADISALGTAHAQAGLGPAHRQQFERVDGHRSCLTLHLDALAGQTVQRLAVALEGGIHGWHLRNRAQVTGNRGLQRTGQVGGHFAGFDHLALGVAGGSALAEARRELVFLVAFEQVTGHLGGLAQADRQHAGGERVKAAGVSGLLATEGATHALHGSVGAESTRLVEQEYSVRHGDPFMRRMLQRRACSVSIRPAAYHVVECRQSQAWLNYWSSRGLFAASIRAVSRAARSKVSSATNSSRGACRNPARRPTSPRRNPAAAFSPACTSGPAAPPPNGT